MLCVRCDIGWRFLRWHHPDTVGYDIGCSLCTDYVSAPSVSICFRAVHRRDTAAALRPSSSCQVSTAAVPFRCMPLPQFYPHVPPRLGVCGECMHPRSMLNCLLLPVALAAISRRPLSRMSCMLSTSSKSTVRRTAWPVDVWRWMDVWRFEG